MRCLRASRQNAPLVARFEPMVTRFGRFLRVLSRQSRQNPFLSWRTHSFWGSLWRVSDVAILLYAPLDVPCSALKTLCLLTHTLFTPVLFVAPYSHNLPQSSPTSKDFRLSSEIKDFLQSPPPNLSLKISSNIRTWVVKYTFDNGVYKGESYKLKLVFPRDYPSQPPSVYFLKPVPARECPHTHVCGQRERRCEQRTALARFSHW